MDRELSSPNFNAAPARSNSSSRVPDYFFSATSHHNRYADSIFFNLPPLHPISTTHEVPCTSVPEHAVPSPTTVCNSPQTNDIVQAAFSQFVAAFGSLGFDFEIRRREAPRNAVQPPIYGASADAVPQPVPIPTQTSLLIPVVPVDGAVANALGQRIAQPQPLAAPATTNPPPPARPLWDPDDRDLLLKSANRSQFTEACGVRIRAFLENAENFLDMCGRPRDRWARFISSWIGANEAEKVRFYHFFGDDVGYTAFKNGFITLFRRLEFEDSYCQQLRELAQGGSESVASYAARTTDLSSRGYPKFPTEIQLDLAVKHFLSGLRDTSTLYYLRR